MKRNALMATALVGALCLATSAWAGGSMCSGKSEGAAKEASAGDHCTTAKGASMAAGSQCKIGADNAVFSFAVPTAHCGSCADKIQSAVMAQKGVLCAKVDIEGRRAYVAGDKKLNQRVIAKAIKNAGYDCSLELSGMKARTELNKLMAADNEKAAAKKS